TPRARGIWLGRESPRASLCYAAAEPKLPTHALSRPKETNRGTIPAVSSGCHPARAEPSHALMLGPLGEPILLEPPNLLRRQTPKGSPPPLPSQLRRTRPHAFVPSRLP